MNRVERVVSANGRNINIRVVNMNQEHPQEQQQPQEQHQPEQQNQAFLRIEDLQLQQEAPGNQRQEEGLITPPRRPRVNIRRFDNMEFRRRFLRLDFGQPPRQEASDSDSDRETVYYLPVQVHEITTTRPDCSYPTPSYRCFPNPNTPNYGPPQSYGPVSQACLPLNDDQYSSGPCGPSVPYGALQGPIINQPGMAPGGPPNGWMNLPQGTPHCPPGLEYLAMIDQLLVHQKVEVLEALVGYESKNKFTVKNSLGQKVYYAVEESDCLTRNCCGAIRPFDMQILDNFRNEVIHLHRPLACDSCCFPCCLQTMQVSSPPGTVVGTIEQEWSIFCPTFAVKNASNDTVLRIEGPFCLMNICGDVEFKIMSSDGQVQVGKISKQWSGLLREMFTDADHFGITFPIDLDVRIKAVMLGACFLIDAMFFEKGGPENNRSLV